MESLKVRRKSLIWISGLTCNGNSHSFLSSSSLSFDAFLNSVNILFHPALTYDREFKDIYKDILEGKLKLDFLIVEGAVSKKKTKVYFQGFDIYEILENLKNIAEYIIAVGNCASFGNFPALYSEDVVGLNFRFNQRNGFFEGDFTTKSGMPIINISGCPAHPEWIIKTVLSLSYGYDLKLGSLQRPKDFYMYLTHDGCTRNQYFEWKVEAEEFGTKEGCLFYYLGCRGPLTHSSCNKILWNDKSSKTRAGMPCIGCTEFDFPLRGKYFETKLNIGIPEEVPLGVSKRAYIMLSGVAKTFTNHRLKGKLEEAD
ncbi:MAG: Ni/Fe hydrogenase [Hydrogenothermaceae bacterium]|nr:Ni/Fe hydrogenase [Hydrogenothermaceae bacterium]